MPKTTHSIYNFRPRTAEHITDKRSCLAYARYKSMQMLKEEFGDNSVASDLAPVFHIP